MGKIKIDTADISDIQRGGGGGRVVCEVGKDLVETLNSILAERDGKPFALPVNKIKELFKYTGKASKTSNVTWTINKHLKEHKLRLISSHTGERVGVEAIPDEPKS